LQVTYCKAGCISQSNVATRFWNAWIFNDQLVANLWQSLSVKEF